MKRTKSLLTSIVTLLLVLQMAAPMFAAAQSDEIPASPAAEVTEPTTVPEDTSADGEATAEIVVPDVATPAPQPQNASIMPLAAANPATFTDVHVIQDSIAACNQNAFFTVSFSFDVSPDADAGQTFTLQLPTGVNGITPIAGGFTALDPYLVKNDAGDVIARGVFSGGVITFTLTDFVDSGVTDITGNGTFDARFLNYVSNTPNGPCGTTAELVFTPSSGGPFTDTVTAPLVPPPSVAAAKGGFWINGVDPAYGQLLRWAISAPADAPVGSTFTITDQVDPAVAGWQFLCNSPAHQPFSPYATDGHVSDIVVVECSPERIVITGVVSGTPTPTYKPRIDLFATVVDGDIKTYSNTAKIDSLDAAGQPRSASPTGTINNPSSGSGGSSKIVVVPGAPTTTVSACVNDQVTQPTLTLPTDATSIISYKVTSGPVTAIGVVTWTVEASISSDNHVFKLSSIQTNAAWEMQSQKLATLTLTAPLAKCPGKIAPAAPTVTASVCTNNVASDPKVTAPANSDGVTYTVAAPVVTGDSYAFTVTATLANTTDYKFDSANMGAWKDNGDGTATWTTTLTKVKCAVALTLPTTAPSVCTNNVASNPAVTTPASTAFITYTAAAPVISGASYTFTITATPASGIVFDAASLGAWTVKADGSATWTTTLTKVKCPVTPAMPTVKASVCEVSGPTTPTITAPANTPFITYTVTAPAIEGAVHSFVVTATAADGTMFVAPLPAGWTLVNETTATFKKSETKITCSTSLDLPVVTASTCDASNVATKPTISELADTSTVDYEMSSSVAGRVYTYTYTGTPAAGFKFDAADMGEWTLNADGTATYTVVATMALCPTAPKLPVIVESACVDGAVVQPVITAAENTAEVSYTVSEPVTDAKGVTYVITATAAEGYVFEGAALAADGWVAKSDTIAELTVSLTVAVCPVATPTAPATTPTLAAPPAVTQLPKTGTGSGSTNVFLLAALGAAGMALVGTALKRRDLTN